MIHTVSFKHFGDYAKEDVPSAAYAPLARQTYADIYSANFSCDMSFTIKEEETSLAYLLLYYSPEVKNGTLWSLGLPAIFWLTSKCTCDSEKDVLMIAEKEFKKRLASQQNATLLFSEYFYNNKLLSPASHLLQYENCNPNFYFTINIELTYDLELLYAQVRKSYKNLINRGMKKFDFKIITDNNIEEKYITALHNCHICASGRDVYPEKFWQAWGHLVRQGGAFIILAYLNGEVKGASLFITCHNRIYYGIGAYDRTFQHSGLSHSMMWQSIIFAKESCFQIFEIGTTYYPSLHHDISDKEISIGFFKRGFGGVQTPLLHLTKTSSLPFDSHN